MDDTVGVGTPSGGAGRIVPAIAIGVAVVLQLVMLAPFTVASGLLAPLWAVVVFHLVWLVGAAVLVLLARRRPLLTPLVPVMNAAILWLGITAGELALGWTP